MTCFYWNKSFFTFTLNYPTLSILNTSPGLQIISSIGLYDSLSDDYAIIIKHHPFIQEKHPIPAEYRDRVIDLSENTEINDLLFVSDLVITDYSSLVFESSLLDIPMLFYAYDLQSYIKSRDFYFDFKLYIPGKICTSLYTLLENISIVLGKIGRSVN